MNSPKVSVLIASYNHERYIGEAISSVLEQSLTDLELIIVDDGSADNTVAVARSFDDPRIFVEALPENVGACGAMSIALDRAKGQYVAVLSSDDFFLPGKLRQQADLLDASPEFAATFGKPAFVNEASVEISDDCNAFAGIFDSGCVTRHEWLRHFFLKGNALCHPTVMMRRPVYALVGGFNPAYRQLPDLDLWVRLCATSDIHVEDRKYVGFRVHREQSNTSFPNAINLRRDRWEYSRILRHYLRFEEQDIYEAFRQDMDDELAERKLSMSLKLALIAAKSDGPHHQLFALEVLHDAVSRGVPGIKPTELHQLAGRLDPFYMPSRTDHLPRSPRWRRRLQRLGLYLQRPRRGA